MDAFLGHLKICIIGKSNGENFTRKALKRHISTESNVSSVISVFSKFTAIGLFQRPTTE